MNTAPKHADEPKLTHTAVPLILGAYASLPATNEEQHHYYRRAATLPGVRGLEIPFRNKSTTAQVAALVAELAPHWDRNLVTDIPGTMTRVGAEPTFGLASANRAGRQAALDYARLLREEVEKICEAAGAEVVMAVELHSAPSGIAGTEHRADAFGESLAQITQWNWGKVQLLVEHCDAFRSADRGEKRFLPLEQEIAVVNELKEEQLAISLNWGRSALEDRDPNTPLAQVRTLAAAGLLAGVMFSGAGPKDTQYAAAWMDGHLPLDVDEPGSVMSAENVRACAEAALANLEHNSAARVPYLGAKCQVPAQANVAERLGYLERILSATGCFNR